MSKTSNLKLIGYWVEPAFVPLSHPNFYELMKELHNPSNYPDPNKLIWPAFWRNRRNILYDFIKILDESPEINRYRGWSTCRICGCHNGSSERSLNGYYWPSGLSHYVLKHSVALPEYFIQDLLAPNTREYRVKHDWVKWGAEMSEYISCEGCVND